jgi:hypothetical protein
MAPEGIAMKEAPDVGDEGKAPHPILAALDKYLEVWLFSILLGALSGLTYSLFSLRGEPGRWGIFGLPFLVLNLGGAIVVVAAWAAMGQYFRRWLVPRFLLKQSSGQIPAVEAARCLERAMSYFVLGILLRILIGLLDLAFQWFRFLD